jgi:hypothetical protein
MRIVPGGRRRRIDRSLAFRKAERRRDERIWAQLTESAADVLPALAYGLVRGGRSLSSPNLQKLLKIVSGTSIEAFNGLQSSDDMRIIDSSSATFSPGPRARALLRGREIAERDLAESGGSYSLDEVRRLLNSISRQSVEKRVREGRLLAVVGRNNKRFYPVAQFNDDGSVVDGLHAIQDAMATRNGYAVLNFLVNPDPRLDNRKPIDLLKQGEIERVVEVAAGIGEQGE